MEVSTTSDSIDLDLFHMYVPSNEMKRLRFEYVVKLPDTLMIMVVQQCI